MMSSDLREIAISEIHENPDALRGVNKNTEDYTCLVDSIRDKGVLNPILVREIKDAEGNAAGYGLIDGLQRFTASQDAGRETIPAQVKSMSDGEVWEAQIITNAHKIETKHVDYAKSLVRILSANPLLTMAELASKLAKTPAWINDHLNLLKLGEPIQKLVNNSEVKLANAIALSRLPAEEQQPWLERAMTMAPGEFVPAANARVKEIAKARREGREATEEVFVAAMHLRKLKEFKDEFAAPTVAPVLIRAANVRSAADGFALGVAWALHQDPESIAAAKTKWEAGKAQAAADKEARAKEQAAKKLANAQAKAEKARQEAEALVVA